MENIIKKGTPKDVFLHLLTIVTLYISVVAFITLWWQYINVLFPDTLQNTTYYGSYYLDSLYGAIRWAMAALIIVFPIYILISWLIGREFNVDPEKREVRVRKWLWYITLFFSAVTIITDLITLVYNFLNGDLTTQFFLKIIVILVVAGAVFGYYLWDLRQREGPSNKPRALAWITSIIILASIVYGFFLIGSPATQRERRFDEQRVSDLNLIQGQIINYWQQRSVVLNSLADLKDSISGFVLPVDPETRQQYEYAVTGGLSFRLCAVFKTSMVNSDNNASKPMRQPGFYEGLSSQNWSHGIGRTCFDRTIDPQIYKPYNNAL